MRDFYKERILRRPTLPPSHPGSTIGAEELNFRDRNGNGCNLLAIATENLNLGKRLKDLKTKSLKPYALYPEGA